MTVKNISFIGAGNMTQSIVEGLVAKGYPPENIMASNPSFPKLDNLQKKLNIRVSQSNTEAIDFAEVVVLSVKPLLMSKVCEDFLKDCDLSNKLVISIAAGIPCKRLIEMLGGHKQVIRVMPNTPSSLGAGMSGIYASDEVSEQDAEFASFMMKHVGDTLIVDKESDIDTVIAAAGSSPAYFFLIAQSMTEEAMRMGLAEKDARKLVQQAMLGSAQMIIQNPDTSIETLRTNVTSKGGTTHEAVTTLQKHDIAHILSEAMQAAVARAQQMAKEF
uniref:pyrroline-5-carboxylate reductase n=1 Tax=Ningiella ruwaisensis TaxID=2364274 RepID=UPI00109FE935|nr:pyrroline-5-carboxylate reductase [Ningiella ruwaisensis]